MTLMKQGTDCDLLKDMCLCPLSPCGLQAAFILGNIIFALGMNGCTGGSWSINSNLHTAKRPSKDAAT